MFLGSKSSSIHNNFVIIIIIVVPFIGSSLSCLGYSPTVRRPHSTIIHRQQHRRDVIRRHVDEHTTIMGGVDDGTTIATGGVSKKMMKRKSFLHRVTTAAMLTATTAMWIGAQPSLAFQASSSSSMIPKSTQIGATTNVPTSAMEQHSTLGTSTRTVAYKALSLSIPEIGTANGGVTVPVACWFPIQNNNDNMPASLEPAIYKHRISISRIGQLLAKWDWIPNFVAKDYSMKPTGIFSSTTSSMSDNKINVVNGRSIPLPKTNDDDDSNYPVIILAHGYLGSRFDLSHLAEELAASGFICIAPEYPESLAASYERIMANENWNRQYINNKLLRSMVHDWNIASTSSSSSSTPSTKFGIIGHSLGTGTVFQTGDETWTRVAIAGFPRADFSKYNALYISSMNDGAVSLNRLGGKQSFVLANYPIIDEMDLMVSKSSSSMKQIPSRSAIVFDREDAPNHISFLAESVNDAMIDLLSPLLPVAQSLGIPVLDFDRYSISRDSMATASVTHPIIIQYLRQEMKL